MCSFGVVAKVTGMWCGSIVPGSTAIGCVGAQNHLTTSMDFAVFSRNLKSYSYITVSGMFLEPGYLRIGIISFVAAVGLPASQHELSGRSRLDLSIREISGKKNTGVASPA
jgi:hypothetical protein